MRQQQQVPKNNVGHIDIKAKKKETGSQTSLCHAYRAFITATCKKKTAVRITNIEVIQNHPEFHPEFIFAVTWHRIDAPVIAVISRRKD